MGRSNVTGPPLAATTNWEDDGHLHPDGDVAAPIDTVFDVLTDHRGYAAITPLRAVTLERHGHPEPDGVGAVRVLKLLGPPIREEVDRVERPTRFSIGCSRALP